MKNQEITELTNTMRTLFNEVFYPLLQEFVKSEVEREVRCRMRKLMEEKVDDELTAYIHKRVRAKVFVHVGVNEA